MTSAPEVSVVMGVHNGAQYLRDSLDSVLDQRGVDFEFIIVNDGSNDESRKILTDYADRDARVRLLHQEHSGLTDALIGGCATARGKYLARQDNGDMSLGGRLAAQKEALEKDGQLAFVSCWSEFCGPGNEFLSFGKGTGIASAPARIVSADARNGMSDGPSCHPSVMMRRDAYVKVGGYRSQFYFGQDWDLWFRLAETGAFQMIERVLYRARVMPDSLSGRYRVAQEKIAALSCQAARRRRSGQAEDDLLQVARTIRPMSTPPITARQRSRGLYFVGEQLRRNGDERAAFYLCAALKQSPIFPRAWLRLLQLRLHVKAR